MPSTSNNIESFHLHNLKSRGKLINRLPTIKLLESLLIIVKDWSLDREPFLFDKDANSIINNPNLRKFSLLPTITKNCWLSAYEWNKKSKSIVKLRENGETLYFTPSGNKNHLTKEECKSFYITFYK